ncbi:unnamed protein product [Mesocestoides corti]|uniref:Uncharacterized protein n=1 Tax=Mesocestoides corti TaxID=53468 RepID=A0A0R3UQJ7_MESCO|nr:unnamed protein product [Mesocestoides corti]
MHPLTGTASRPLCYDAVGTAYCPNHPSPLPPPLRPENSVFQRRQLKTQQKGPTRYPRQRQKLVNVSKPRPYPPPFGVSGVGGGRQPALPCPSERGDLRTNWHMSHDKRHYLGQK